MNTNCYTTNVLYKITYVATWQGDKQPNKGHAPNKGQMPTYTPRYPLFGESTVLVSCLYNSQIKDLVVWLLDLKTTIIEELLRYS